MNVDGPVEDSAVAVRAAGQIALLVQASVAEQLASAVAHGGQLNPRGR